MRCAAIIFEGKVVSVEGAYYRSMSQGKVRIKSSNGGKYLLVLKLEAKSSSSLTFLGCLDTVISWETGKNLQDICCNNCVSPSILFFNFPLHIPENRRKTGRHLLAYFETHAAGENLLPSKFFFGAGVGWVGNEETMGK